MASGRLPNYLLSHRKRTALSQTEVAFLLGVKSGAKVCRHERFTLEPGLQSALAYEAIYQRPISDLFPGLVEKVRGDVNARVKILKEKELRSNTNALTTRKRQSLAAILPSSQRNQAKK
jgi:hypothetical protein